MNIFEQEVKTDYQIMRQTDREIGDFLEATFSNNHSYILDDHVAKFQHELRTREEAKKIVDEQLKRYFEGLRSAPWSAIRGKGKAVHIAIDSEWVFNPETGKNDILCYSYCVQVGDKFFKGVKHTEMAKLIKACREQGLPKDEEMLKRKLLANRTKSYKVNFDKFIQELLIKAKARGFIDE